MALHGLFVWKKQGCGAMDQLFEPLPLEEKMPSPGIQPPPPPRREAGRQAHSCSWSISQTFSVLFKPR